MPDIETVAAEPAPVVFTTQQEETFTPPGSPRSYVLGPMTYRQRQAFRADMAKEAGIYPNQGQVLEALREAARGANPSNLAQVLEVLDAAEADTEGADTAVTVALAAIEAQLCSDPVYGALLAARRRWLGMAPFCAARYALRGWSGPGLPAFRLHRGTVPEELLDSLPEGDLSAVGNRAMVLMQPNRTAEGNSAPPSP